MIDHIFAAIRPQLIILTIVYLLVLFVIFLDLWAGIRKARKRGELRSSLGYRKTVEKIAKYFNLIFVVTAIDAVQMLTVWQINEQTGSRLPLIPILTVLGAMFIGFIELKSVYEKSEDKEKAKIADAAAALGSALKNRETQGIVAAGAAGLPTCPLHVLQHRGPARSEQAPGPEFMPNPDIYDEE